MSISLLKHQQTFRTGQPQPERKMGLGSAQVLCRDPPELWGLFKMVWKLENDGKCVFVLLIYVFGLSSILWNLLQNRTSTSVKIYTVNSTDEILPWAPQWVDWRSTAEAVASVGPQHIGCSWDTTWSGWWLTEPSEKCWELASDHLKQELRLKNG